MVNGDGRMVEQRREFVTEIRGLLRLVMRDKGKT